MATRLDRLFVLLDTGSTPLIRKSAAEQLGQVQKLHPHELENLLTKVHQYLCSSTWETRIAAGQAVHAICSNVPQWQPTGLPKSEAEFDSGLLLEGRLSLSQFNIERVLKYGASLMASEGKEYDAPELAAGADRREQLARQKQLLNKRLGLDVAGGLGVQLGEELFGEEDLILKAEPVAATHGNPADVQKLVSEQLRLKGMSARERNRAKRKARALARQPSRDACVSQHSQSGHNGDSSPTIEEPRCKSRRMSSTSMAAESSADEKIVIDNSSQDAILPMEEDWPFESFCDLLMNDLFNTSWEKRHGAATGLREVVKTHGRGAGRSVDTPVNQQETANQQWLEDAAIRLICVMSLDRFGDFVSDEVVAPVRETCAQTLGTVLNLMQEASVLQLVQVLLQLLQQVQWEVRHGGFLGLKYLLAVKKDMSKSLLPEIVPFILIGFQDASDDVRTVAASSLLPVANDLVVTLPQVVAPLLQCLWVTLQDLDDLTASTSSIMTLLAILIAHPDSQAHIDVSADLFLQQVAQLFPFLYHYIPSVRLAALDTLAVLMGKYQYSTQVDQGLVLLVIQSCLRHLYQRALLEDRPDILDSVHVAWQSLVGCVPGHALLSACSQLTGAWLCMMMQASRLPFDANMLLEAKHFTKELSPTRPRLALSSANQEPRSEVKDRKHYIGGNDSVNDVTPKRDLCVIRARLLCARLLGALFTKMATATVQQAPADPTMSVVVETPMESLCKLQGFHLNTKSAIQRFCVALVLTEWAKASQESCTWPTTLLNQLHACLVETIYYDEMALTFARLQKECQDFRAGLRQEKLSIDNHLPASVTVLTVEQAQHLASAIFDEVKVKLRGRKLEDFESRRQGLLSTVEQMAYEQQILSSRVQCSIAGCLVALRSLPATMNPIVRPLMEAVKKEENAQIQNCVAEHISRLVKLCVRREPCPTPKIVKNLCTWLCSDPLFTPVVGSASASQNRSQSALATSQDKNQSSSSHPGSLDNGNSYSARSCSDKYSGILTLDSTMQLAHNTQNKRGRPSLKRQQQNARKAAHIVVEELIQDENEERRNVLVQRRGASLSLTYIAGDLGDPVIAHVPQLWAAMTEELDITACKETTADGDARAQALVNCLQVIEVVAPALSHANQLKLLDKLSGLRACLAHVYSAVRHMSGRALSSLARLHTQPVMEFLLEHIMPLLGATDSVPQRQGAVETIANMLETLGLDVVPYIVLLVVPILGRMSDQNEAVRLMATQCFATLIKLLPLEAGVPSPPTLKPGLMEQRQRERQFLEQLLDGSKIEPYTVPIPINAKLRSYQQDGINWLAFLNKYKLHGILCDDMGLGKTLQALCIVGGDTFLRAQQYKDSKCADCRPLPSIVVCPPTVTGHWLCEVQKFVDSKYLNPLHYSGPPTERARLQKQVKKHNLVVASYEVVRNDISFFRGIMWNYCILDEGHIIKNSKTKISRAVKQLECNHRLILSGTPIQNNVLELWSLFDFLMPGFLASERQFQARYGRPILLSRDAKSSPRDQQAGALAMEALHRQVLPFLLRRMKEDVLKDLPPKIIQDCYCDLSPLQVRLYEDFAKSRAKKSVEDTVKEEDSKTANFSTHIFQALQYLRKVCNHPALVLNPQHPEYEALTAMLAANKTPLRHLSHSPKLTALKQLLLDCGIGTGGGVGSEAGATDAPVVSAHRVLLFCQLKSMLDIVETDLLKTEMPSVTYLRLDGSVPAANRIGIVNRFNNDPSIDVLLLTTHVGGLGLNLTGADTVIFVEHDWNPMKDLQAMDRAHRIGQKRVVNVYRLITRGTLEEKIMGLQKFKLSIANTVISQENSSLASMGTGQLLDLFSLDERGVGAGSAKGAGSVGADPAEAAVQKGSGMKQVLDSLEELWDEKQYENEYDLSSFMQSLHK